MFLLFSECFWINLLSCPIFFDHVKVEVIFVAIILELNVAILVAFKHFMGCYFTNSG